MFPLGALFVSLELSFVGKRHELAFCRSADPLTRVFRDQSVCIVSKRNNQIVSRMLVHTRCWHKVNVINRKFLIPIYKIQAATTGTMTTTAIADTGLTPL